MWGGPIDCNRQLRTEQGDKRNEDQPNFKSRSHMWKYDWVLAQRVSFIRYSHWRLEITSRIPHQKQEKIHSHFKKLI